MTVAHVPGEPFEFSSIVFADPTSGGQRGGYFSRLSLPNSNPFLIQTPTTISKSGIATTTRSTHMDIEVESNSAMHQWLVDLESHILETITANSDKWFTSPMTADEISYLLVPICKRQAKREFMRATIPVARYAAQSRGLSVFDENEVAQPQSSITSETRFIGVIELVGIRFTSTAMRIELNLKQVMILGEVAEPVCLVKKTTIDPPPRGVTNNMIETSEQDDQDDAKHDDTDDADAPFTTNIIGEPEVKSEIQTSLAAATTPQSLEEVNIDAKSGGEGIQLKEKHEVYKELYQELYDRARMAKKQAIRLYLEAQELQVEHALDAIESSDDEDENEHMLQ